MNSAVVRRIIQLASGALGAALGAMLIPAGEEVYGGHPWTCADPRVNPVCQEGSCHRGVLICRTNYASAFRGSTVGAPGQAYMNIRDIPQWLDPLTGTDYTTTFDSPAFAAELAWRGAPGPQYPTRYPAPNDSFNYLNAADDPEGLIPQYYLALAGITYLCNDQRFPECTHELGDSPIDIQWADVYLNTRFVGIFSYDDWRSTLAHELGHTFGLGHHAEDSVALMEPTSKQHTVFAPTSIDLGVNIDTRDGGVAADLYGIRGIYGWYETPTPGPTATPGSGGGPGGCNPGQGKCT